MVFDVHFAFRSLRRSPGAVGAAVVAIALGVGANTAIFSVLNATLLHPLPYPDSDRLVMLWDANPKIQGFVSQRLPVANRNVVEWRRGLQSYAHIEVLRQSLDSLTGLGAPQQGTVGRVTPGLLGLFGQTDR